MLDIYIRTDLASEIRQEAGAKEAEGVVYRQEQDRGVDISHIEIYSEQAEKVLNKPKGNYVTLSFESVIHMDNQRRELVCEILSDRIRRMLDSVCSSLKSVCVIGLGNRRITADALGPRTVDQITVTHHLKQLSPSLFEKVGQLSVSALTPGVLGDTGVEAAVLACKTVEAVMPDAVIVVDALAARSVERLGCTVQLSDAGIEPGAGVGNRRMAMTRDTLGVPVIAIGVPTVVHSATLVRDALEKAGIDRIDSDLEKVLREGESFFVTQKECDSLLEVFSGLLSQSIDMALSASL